MTWRRVTPELEPVPVNRGDLALLTDAARKLLRAGFYSLPHERAMQAAIIRAVQRGEACIVDAARVDKAIADAIAICEARADFWRDGQMDEWHEASADERQSMEELCRNAAAALSGLLGDSS